MQRRHRPVEEVDTKHISQIQRLNVGDFKSASSEMKLSE